MSSHSPNALIYNHSHNHDHPLVKNLIFVKSTAKMAIHPQLVIPLCTSSATLGLSLFQYPVFLSFMHARPSIAGRPLSSYWQIFLKQSVGLVTASGLLSTAVGAYSWRWLHTHGHLETTAVAKWYGYGALLALGHFVFVPLVAAPIKKITDNAPGDGVDAKGDDAVEEVNRQEMVTWFKLHTIRTLLIDLPAVWCFAEGVALSMWVV